jgi:hypothetical protein
MEMGVMIVAEADAVAVACAKEVVEKAIAIAAVASTFEMFFIFCLVIDA